MFLKSYSRYSNTQSFYSLSGRLTESSALFVTHFLRTLAMGMVGIFLPIYIYKLSPSMMVFSTDEVINGLMWVISYFFLRSIFVVLFLEFLGSFLFTKINFHKGIFLSFVALVAEIITWILAQYNLNFMFLAGFFAGLKVFLYWIPYHIYFVNKSGGGDRFVTKTSHRFFYNQIAAAIAPLLGGVIISFFGFNVLYVLSIVLLLFASVPILRNVQDWKHEEHRMLDIAKKYIFNRKFSKYDIGYIGEGLESAVISIFWPILLFISLGSFVKYGFLNAVAVGCSSVGMLVVGKYLSKHGYKSIHGFGVGVVSTLHVVRAFTGLPVVLYAAELVDKVSSSIYGLPIMSITYDKAKKYGVSDFILFREVTIHLAISLFLAVLILILPLVGTWRWVFLVGAVGAILTYFLDKKSSQL